MPTEMALPFVQRSPLMISNVQREEAEADYVEKTILRDVQPSMIKRYAKPTTLSKPTSVSVQRFAIPKEIAAKRVVDFPEMVQRKAKHPESDVQHGEAEKSVTAKSVFQQLESLTSDISHSDFVQPSMESEQSSAIDSSSITDMIQQTKSDRNKDTVRRTPDITSDLASDSPSIADMIRRTDSDENTDLVLRQTDTDMSQSSILPAQVPEDMVSDEDKKDEEEKEEINLDELARQVYPRIRRLLTIEHERRRGSFRLRQ